MPILGRFWGGVLLGGLLAFFATFAAAEGQQSPPSGQKNDRAPAFVLKDLAGHDVRLDDYKGKPVLLYFMASWCPQCRGMIPRLKEIDSLYSPKGLVILNISVMESREKMLAYSKRHNLPYKSILDTDGKIAQSYGVFGLPVMALLDREGRIICWNCRTYEKLLEKQLEPKGQ
jgi:peroxiredoxin